MKKIAIVGGGIAGLTAAWLLHKKCEVVLYEKSHRVGGWIHSLEKEGFLFEQGPRGFRPQGKGEKTLQLAYELGLTPIAANISAKKRFLLQKGALMEVTPFKLMRFFPALVRECFISPSTQEETIHAFFSRRFGSHFTESFIDPLASGIFGGDARTLSLQASFPRINAWEKKHGSVVLGYLKNRKKNTHPPLLSFQEGMEMLPKRLFERLSDQIKIHLSTPVENLEELECDHVIFSAPQVQFPYLTLTTVSLGWDSPILPLKAFGYLIPSREKEAILGVTFDSEIFPTQKGICRLCVMIRGEVNNALEIALNALKRHLGIAEPPTTYHIQVARNAIPQYVLGHTTRLREMPKTGKMGVTRIGNLYGGVGVNDTIQHVFDTLLESFG